VTPEKGARPTRSPDRVVVSVSFPREDLEGVTKLAMKRDETLSELIRGAVVQYVARAGSTALIAPSATADWTVLTTGQAVTTISVSRAANLPPPESPVVSGQRRAAKSPR